MLECFRTTHIEVLVLCSAQYEVCINRKLRTYSDSETQLTWLDVFCETSQPD